MLWLSVSAFSGGSFDSTGSNANTFFHASSAWRCTSFTLFHSCAGLLKKNVLASHRKVFYGSECSVIQLGHKLSWTLSPLNRRRPFAGQQNHTELDRTVRLPFGKIYVSFSSKEFHSGHMIGALKLRGKSQKLLASNRLIFRRIRALLWWIPSEIQLIWKFFEFSAFFFPKS